MILAVPLKEEYIKDVLYLELHLAIELNSTSSFHITNEEVLQNFVDKLFKSFVICNTNSLYQRPLGFITYAEDYSLENGHGFYVDSFYVIEGLRNHNLGHLLMSRLCDEILDLNYNYIKLYFPNNEKHRLLYSKIGFCNESLYDKKLNLMEVYSPAKVEEFLLMKSHPTACSLDTDVVVSPVISTVDKSLVIMVNVFQSHTNKFAGFTEQMTYSGWLGPMIIFKDFVGSTNILDINLFKSRVRERRETGRKPMGIWFEIPESHINLISALELFGVRNISKLEGWEIGYLYRHGTNDFSYFKTAFPPRGSVKCGTMDKFDELYRNVYFC